MSPLYRMRMPGCMTRPSSVHRYTQSADIWAFGIIMLELATGQVPRKGMGFVSLVMQTVHGDVPSLADAATKRTYSKVCRPCPVSHADSIRHSRRDSGRAPGRTDAMLVQMLLVLACPVPEE